MTEYIEPFNQAQLQGTTTKAVPLPGASSFLNTFLETPYPQIARKA